VPKEEGPARQPVFERLFLGSSTRAWREEKVLQYIIHRINGGTRLPNVLQEEYVRRNCPQNEIDEIINNPELVHACRARLEMAFESDELSPRRHRR
jgi:hypothetical protein